MSTIITPEILMRYVPDNEGTHELFAFYRKIELAKDQFVKKQMFEEAAAKRDMAKRYLSELLDLWPNFDAIDALNKRYEESF